jgi:hypothetical protein
MPTPEDYKEARRLAIHAVRMRDLKICCHNADLDFQKISEQEQQATIPYLGREYLLRFSEETIAFEPEDALSIPDQVLLLHYLVEATGDPLENRWISFREIPSGPFYYPSFVKRAVTPLVKALGHCPEAFKGVARSLGRAERTPGDAALRVEALPRIPIVLSLWTGDEEFPADGNVYFDASISSYLGTEDIAYIAGATVYRVLTIARNAVKGR